MKFEFYREVEFDYWWKERLETWLLFYLLWG